MSDYLDPANEELLKDFFDESDQQVSLFEQNILAIENDPSNREAIDEMFRAAHTLKGAAATVQMDELTSFTHAVEDALDEIRSGNAEISDLVVEALLQSIDTIKTMLEYRSSGAAFEDDTSELVSMVKRSVGIETKAPAVTARSSAKNDSAEDAMSAAKAHRGQSGTPAADLSEYELLELIDETAPDASLYRVDVRFDEENPMNTVGGIQVYAALRDVGTVVASSPVLDDLYEDVFYETVRYFVASEADPRAVSESASVEDVTLDVEMHTLKDASSSAEEVAGTAGETADESAGEFAAAVTAKTVGESRTAEPTSANVASGEEAEDSSGADSTDVDESASKRNDVKAKAASKRGSGVAGGSILRVDSRRIDDLLNLVSEAVINKATFNQISQTFTQTIEQLQRSDAEFGEGLKALFNSAVEFANGGISGDSASVSEFLDERFGYLFGTYKEFSEALRIANGSFKATAQNLSRITGDLQEGVMQIRMVPISQIFSRFPRLVRDVSKSLHKDVNLEILGEDTELDKSVIEDLLDPLIHCVRNAVDHGIESPADRTAAGKPQSGTVVLRAGNEGNLIVIDIEDDGKGINVESIHQKAVDRGLIHPNKQLSDLEAYNLIFEPGFSTASIVTDISGRGVGLDVVKNQIEKLNGTVNVWSDPAVGTKITIKLPLTLAILQGLLVRVGGEVYAIPIASVVESHRVTPDGIRHIDSYDVMDVRDEVISLLRLSRLFRIEAAENPKHHYVVIVGSEEKKIGLIVDSLIGEEDVVIKPLKDRFSNTPGIAGATILGDGRVALIIDVSQLLDLGIAQDSENRKRRAQAIV